MYVNSGAAYFYNSTIAFNNATIEAGVVNSAHAARSRSSCRARLCRTIQMASDSDFFIVNPIAMRSAV
jgi:hypothetical protein